MPIHIYGTYSGGVHLIAALWPTAFLHRSEIALDNKDTNAFTGRPSATEFVGTAETSPDDLLNQDPVEVLIADHSWKCS